MVKEVINSTPFISAYKTIEKIARSVPKEGFAAFALNPKLDN